jgi:aminopeptidase N
MAINGADNRDTIKSRWRKSAAFFMNFLIGEKIKMNKLWRFVLILISSSLLLSCQQPGQDAKRDSEITSQTIRLDRNAVPYLEQDYAVMRAKQITNVSYKLTMNLDAQTETYSGEIFIDFSLADKNISPVTVDFNSGKVNAVYLNGTAINFEYQQYFLQLAPEIFTQTKNTLRIEFERQYSKAGDGLHRYKDPQTGNVYLYSNFEPYNANKMFPHFDQPNIKASYELSVSAPADWQVVSAQRESSVTDDNGKKRWLFPVTPKIPSYIFPLHAGPYKIWEDKSGSVALRLFARQEIAQYVQPQEWFTFTQQSFDFYNQYFEIEYPFGKYDQLVVPDFNAGAMENLGAVTFNEIYVGRGVKTRLERFRHADVISHELAHMWFGNLVTMDWWNGLWLNESFATYMSYLQLSKNSEFVDESWDLFYSRMKQWAYTEDQQVTTHPIELPVANTAEAFTNFDGITYGKGASVLKQLAYYVGEENFRKGVANYLKKYSYSNTELTDFMNEVAQAGNLDLTGWTQEWLYLAGLNTIQVEYACGNNQDVSPLSEFSVVQTAPQDHPTLRTQKIELGFYQTDNSANQQTIYQTAVAPLVYAGEKTSLTIEKNMACPDFVYPNMNDMAYVKIALDKKSLNTVKQHLQHFDSAMRTKLWQHLWDDVLDQRMALVDYVDLLETSLISDAPADVAATSTKMRTARDYLWQMRDVKNKFENELIQLEKISWRELQLAQAGSDIQKIWFDNYVQMAYTPAALNRLADYVSGKQKVQGLVYDQDRRWATLVRLNIFQHKAALGLTEKEKKKDASDMGQQWSLVSEASRPDIKIKATFFEKIIAKNQEYKLATARLIMVNLFPASQMEYREAYAANILFNIPQLHETQDERFVSAYLGMLPRVCTTEGVNRLSTALNQHASLSPVINRYLKIAIQEEQRCVDMKKLMAK